MLSVLVSAVLSVLLLDVGSTEGPHPTSNVTRNEPSTKMLACRNRYTVGYSIEEIRKFNADSVTIRRLTGVVRIDFMNEITALSGPEIGAVGTIQQMRCRLTNGHAGKVSGLG